MKKILFGFFRRGISACGIGPMVLAVLYLILGQTNRELLLTPQEVFVGIVSIALLAFIAGGMNVIYQVERLPLMVAILLHGTVLYLSYLATYLVNRWLEWGATPLLVFSAIFVIGYLLIWAVIYCIVKRNTDKINQKLLDKQKEE